MAGGEHVVDRDLERELATPRVAGGSRGHLHRAEGLGAAVLVGPYLILLMIAGIVPTIYAVVQSLQSTSGTGFAGLANFALIIGDFRFFATFENILITLLVWIPIMMVGVVGLALLVHASPGKLGSSMRIIYYIPGAMAGMANFMLWLFLLNPGQSPLDFLWHGFSYTNLNQVAQPSHLPLILAAMLFFQGAGTWLVIVNGGLNGIPDEVLEAGIVDGAGPVLPGLAHQAPDHPAVARLHAAPQHRLRVPAVRRAAGHEPGDPWADLGAVVAQPVELHVRLPDHEHAQRRRRCPSSCC